MTISPRAEPRALREASNDMLDRMFGGSVEGLLMSLVKNNRLDADKFAKVQKLIESQEQADTEEWHGRG